MTIAEQRAAILAAIDKATNPGSCRYLDENDVPSCVVGCLAFDLGVTVGELKGWSRDGGAGAGKNIGDVLESGLPGSEKLKDFPLKPLSWVQGAWDGRYSVESARVGARTALDDAMPTQG